jgi:hypothetical protein
MLCAAENLQRRQVLASTTAALSLVFLSCDVGLYYSGNAMAEEVRLQDGISLGDEDVGSALSLEEDEAYLEDEAYWEDRVWDGTGYSKTAAFTLEFWYFQATSRAPNILKLRTQHIWVLHLQEKEITILYSAYFALALHFQLTLPKPPTPCRSRLPALCGQSFRLRPWHWPRPR